MVNQDRPTFLLQKTTQYKGHLGTWHPLYSAAKKPMQHLEGYSNSHDLISGVFSWTWPWLPVLNATADLHPFSYICQQLAPSAPPLSSGKLKALCEFLLPCSILSEWWADRPAHLAGIFLRHSSQKRKRSYTATAKESRTFTHLFKEKPGKYSG